MTYTKDRGEGTRLTNNKCGPAGGEGRDLQVGPCVGGKRDFAFR